MMLIGSGVKRWRPGMLPTRIQPGTLDQSLSPDPLWTQLGFAPMQMT